MTVKRYRVQRLHLMNLRHYGTDTEVVLASDHDAEVERLTRERDDYSADWIAEKKMAFDNRDAAVRLANELGEKEREVERLTAQLAEQSTPQKWMRWCDNRALDRIESLQAEVEKWRKDAERYHDAMDALRRTRMPHGLCYPRERQACSHCNALERIDVMLSEYKGRRVVLASAALKEQGNE